MLLASLCYTENCSCNLLDSFENMINEIVIKDLKYFYLLFYEPFILYLLTLLAFLQ